MGGVVRGGNMWAWGRGFEPLQPWKNAGLAIFLADLLFSGGGIPGLKTYFTIFRANFLFSENLICRGGWPTTPTNQQFVATLS